MHKIEIQVECLPGDGCWALNYNLKPARWEHGVVCGVKAGISKDGSAHIAYSVILDRRSTGRSRMFHNGGAPLSITVGKDAIKEG